MGLSTALSNAYTGLVASSRRAEVTSHNIANATTEGYARREVEVSTLAIDGNGRGVYVVGTELSQTPGLTANRRAAEAEVGWQRSTADAAESLARLIGDPDDPSALFSRYDNLEASLRALSDAPQSSQAQLDVLVKAKDLSSAFNAINDGVAALRTDVDNKIARQVDTLNRVLEEFADLNADIRRTSAANADSSELIAQRENMIDEIASIVPVRAVPRENGNIALFTTNGLLLAESSAATFGFSKAGIVSAGMDLVGGAPGALSTLTVNGVDVTPSTDNSNRIGGGSLGALFQIRDVATVEFQTQIDALANDLIDRFDTAAAEPGITPGDPGIFTDAGAAASGLAGLAGRLSVNALVDPDQGGSLLAIRDGIGVAAGDVGDNTHAVALLDAMTSAQTAPAGSGLVGSKSLVEFAADFASAVATDSNSADAALAMRQARYGTYYEAETAANGVDLDRELQELTLVENAYSANARVMQVIDTLFRTLMEI